MECIHIQGNDSHFDYYLSKKTVVHLLKHSSLALSILQMGDATKSNNNLWKKEEVYNNEIV